IIPSYTVNEFRAYPWIILEVCLGAPHRSITGPYEDYIVFILQFNIPGSYRASRLSSNIKKTGVLKYQFINPIVDDSPSTLKVVGRCINMGACMVLGADYMGLISIIGYPVPDPGFNIQERRVDRRICSKGV